MTEEKSNMNKYIRSVKRRLNLPRQVRERVMTDFLTTISAMEEAGKSHDEIIQELGSPKKAAGVLNEQMKEFAYRKSPWRYVFLALAILSGLWLAWYAGLTMFARILANEAASIGIIGGADGPTAIFVTTSPGFDWDIVLMAGLLIGGIAGFLRLRRCKPKR